MISARVQIESILMTRTDSLNMVFLFAYLLTSYVLDVLSRVYVFVPITYYDFAKTTFLPEICLQIILKVGKEYTEIH